MSTAEVTNAIINLFTALGTVAVAILAIYGDWARALLYGPKLKLVLQNPRGSVVPLTDKSRACYYHLVVVNARRNVSAPNCRVILKKMWRRTLANTFQEIMLPVPLTFVWAPSETTPIYIILKNEHRLDFGRVCEGKDQFCPILQSYTCGFEGVLRAEECIRYGLEIVSDNFVSPELQVFEVAWNGKWSDNLDSMAQHLQIREIVAQASMN